MERKKNHFKNFIKFISLYLMANIFLWCYLQVACKSANKLQTEKSVMAEITSIDNSTYEVSVIDKKFILDCKPVEKTALYYINDTATLITSIWNSLSMNMN